MAPTQLHERQINFRQIFSAEQMLLSNGYEVDQTTTIPPILVDEEKREALEILYNSLADEKSRNELRSYTYYGTETIIQENNKQLLSVASFVRDKGKFDNSLEWFTGELMIRKFAALSAGRSITVKNVLRNSTGHAAGDYDAIAVLRNMKLAYFECKSGTYDYNHFLKCHERMVALNCQFSIIIAQQVIKDEDIRWLSKGLRLPVLTIHHLNRYNIKNNADAVYEIENCYIMDMTGNFENKIRTILRTNDAKNNAVQQSFGVDAEKFNAMGYDVQTLEIQPYLIEE